MKRNLLLLVLAVLSISLFAGGPDDTVIRPQEDHGESGGSGGGLTCPEGKVKRTYPGKMQRIWDFDGCQKRTVARNCTLTVCEDK